VARQRRPSDKLDGELIYTGRSVTPIGSARGRQSMHATVTEDLTDRMKMFRCGVEGGRPRMNPVRVEKSKTGIVKVVPLG